jgi:hypothetical protein
MNELHELAIKHGTDKASHGYTQPYYETFQPIRDNPIKFLEIGVYGGNSIRMWLEFFNRASIYGVDINHANGESDPGYSHVIDPGKPSRAPIVNPLLSDPRYSFTQGDQSSTPFWNTFIENHGSDWYIIIDDGGHTARGIITSYWELWPHVSSGGFYCIEDLGCAVGCKYQIPGGPNQVDLVRGLVGQMGAGNQGRIRKMEIWGELVIIQKL